MNNQHYLDIPQEFREQLIPVREEQIQLAKTLDLERKLSLGNIRLVAGLDVAYSKDDSLACAGITVVDFRTFEIVEEAIDFFKPPIPYIPSFLHLRESGGYHTVIKKLDEQPDLFIFDGNGIIHPYGLGLACQMGLEINKPTMGIAKKLLLGEFVPPLQKGGYSEIYHNEVIIGAAYQTSKLPAKPVFVSQGHMIDLQAVINVVREFTQRQIYQTKLPLPILLADKLVREKLGEKG